MHEFLDSYDALESTLNQRDALWSVREPLAMVQAVAGAIRSIRSHEEGPTRLRIAPTDTLQTIYEQVRQLFDEIVLPASYQSWWEEAIRDLAELKELAGDQRLVLDAGIRIAGFGLQVGIIVNPILVVDDAIVVGVIEETEEHVLPEHLAGLARPQAQPETQLPELREAVGARRRFEEKLFHEGTVDRIDLRALERAVELQELQVLLGVILGLRDVPVAVDVQVSEAAPCRGTRPAGASTPRPAARTGWYRRCSSSPSRSGFAS